MRVLVVGDSAIDYFIACDVPRLAPEIPVPALVPHSLSSNPGMAANVAANLKSLVPDFDIVTLFPKVPSVKTRYVDRKTNHHFVRIDQDSENESLTGADWLSAIKMCPDAVVISDYGKHFLNIENMEMIARFCSENGVLCVADVKALLGEWSHCINIVKINDVEFAAHLKAGCQPWKECQRLIVTRSGDGMDLYGQDGSIIYHSPGIKAEVADSAGCGDSVCAALVVKYLENGGNIKTAMDYANKVGAVAVSKRGVVAVKREEVE